MQPLLKTVPIGTLNFTKTQMADLRSTFKSEGYKLLEMIRADTQQQEVDRVIGTPSASLESFKQLQGVYGLVEALKTLPEQIEQLWEEEFKGDNDGTPA